MFAILPLVVGLALAGSIAANARGRAPAQPQAASGAIVRLIGTVQAIQGDALTLKTDSGAEVHVHVQGSTRMLRVEPGQKSLSGATPLQLQDLQVGDRVLVIGTSAEGAVEASSLIAIKRSDIARKQESEAMEWQKNGIGGLVKTVDAATGVIMITARVGSVNKTINIQTSPHTILRRYAPGSVKFEDAKPGTLGDIKPGDQLRARGTFNADHTELAAAEIVSGSFRNIAGPVMTIDGDANEITVMDRLTKQLVVVKFTPDSELRKLPDSTAQMIALRLRRTEPQQQKAGAGEEQATPRAAAEHSSEASGSSQAVPPEKAEHFNQLVSSLPLIKVDDLHKGDIVMVVSTEGATSGSVTAVKLVSGAGPILTAAPAGRQASTLQSLWSGFSTSGSGGGGEGGTESSTSQAPASR